MQIIFSICRNKMIKLNLPVLFAQKGMRVIDAEKKVDLARSTLYRLYNNEATRIDFDSIEKLCKLLECTPNDLFIISEDKADD